MCLTWERLREFDPEGRTRFLCPLCEVERPYRALGVDPKTGVYHCFRCGAKGRLGEYGAEGYTPPPAPPKSDVWRRLWEESEPIKEGWEWRGVTKWGPCRFHKCFYGVASVVFPFQTESGENSGCQGRRVGSFTGPKAMTAAGSTLGIFNSSTRAYSADPLILCEGPMDALTLDQVGYPAVAAFGTQLPRWINRLTWWRRVAIATDADEAGDRAAEEWGEKILCRGVQRLRPEVGKDWNEWLERDEDGLRRYLDGEVYRHEGEHPCRSR